MKLTRRQLLTRIGLGAGTTVLSSAAIAVLGLPSTNAGESDQLLLEPSALPIRRLEPDLVEATLVATVAPVRVGGLNIQALSYNGSLPGPTIRVRESDRVRIKFENRLSTMQRTSMPMDMQHSHDATNLHTHGLHISPSVDDPFKLLEPGESRIHEFTIPKNSAGTYWYHPHPHGHVATQQFSGLYGAIIVEGGLEQEPEFRDADTRLLVLSDLSINFGQVEWHSIFDLLGKQGNLFLVNGQYQPRLKAQASTLRLRLINASVARPFKLRLEHHTLHLIATDGGYLEKPIELETLFLAPGERAEVMVQLQAGTFRLLRLPYNRGGFFSDLRGGAGIEETLLTIVAPNLSRVSPIPKRLVTIEKLIPNASMVKRKIEFGMDFPLVFTLNERLFDMNRVDIKTKLDTLEVWEIANTTTLDHPFHLHTYPFQILERQITGVWKPEPYMAWKDVVNLRGNERVRIAVRFADFTGKTVYHCHVAEHEDRGMMGIIEVNN
jgi:FtsP/CotA-like multicopper oxidase with cupredoxin domain